MVYGVAEYGQRDILMIEPVLEGMEALRAVENEVQNYSSNRCTFSIALTGCDVFGAQANMFPFINLACDE